MYTAEELVWATQLAYCDFEDVHKGELVGDIFSERKEQEKKRRKIRGRSRIFHILQLQ